MSNVDLLELIELSEAGNPHAREQLFSILYRELHDIAERQLKRHANLTLSPTTLLHEAYVNMSGRGPAAFHNQAHFLGYAGRAMRNLLIDFVRRRWAQKRGGEFEITVLTADLPAVTGDLDLQQIGEAVESLAAIDERLARIVDLKFFCGLSNVEIAGILDVSDRTVRRDWDKARMLLQDLMSAD